MRVAIRHETVFHYEDPANYSAQYLRLTPASGANQRILSWKISAPGTLSAWTDGFGNAAHTLVVDHPHEEIRITALGEVEIADGSRPLLAEGEIHPPALYLRPTRLTQPDDILSGFANGFKPGVLQNQRKGLETLMTGIRETVRHQNEDQADLLPAHKALVQKTGASRDHAHLFVSCCRSLGVPARYVSGYLCQATDSGRLTRGHAWAEAWVEGTGWLAYDVSNGRSNANAHIRVAVGLDYHDAAFVRSFRRGGAGPSSVDIAIGDATLPDKGARRPWLEQQQQQQ